MLEVLKVIILGIVQGITEWLPISSTGHLILVEQLIQLKQSEAFTNMFNVVIQFGSIMAVVVIYFHKLNPFSPTKTEKQKKMTIQLWIKVVIGTIPALIGGVLLNDLIESKLSNAYVVALMLIVYGILFIIIEKRNETREPKVKRLSQLSVKTVLLIGVFQMMAMIPGTSRSGATIVGALALGVSRGVAAEFTFFLAIPVMFGASALKLFKFGLAFTPMQVFLLLLGMIVSFAVSVIAIKFLMKYIKNHDFKAFGYYRIVLGIIVFFVHILERNNNCFVIQHNFVAEFIIGVILDFFLPIIGDKRIQDTLHLFLFYTFYDFVQAFNRIFNGRNNIASQYLGNIMK